MKFNISGYFQVVEYNTARHMMYLAGLGQRRAVDDKGDNLIIYPERGPMGWYVPTETTQEPLAYLTVDEGVYSDAMYTVDDSTEIGYTNHWCEYVDSSDLMRLLCKKLVPGAKIVDKGLLGAGSRQMDFMSQHVTHLLKWSKLNPEHPLKFT